MGDPRKSTNKYESPRKVWDADRIKTEGKLSSTYGLKNTREVWRNLYELKKARRGAMKFLSKGDAGEEEAKPLMNRLSKLGITAPEAKVDDVLALSVENFLDRRLQTRVMKKGLARTAKQARQLITHGFIAINGKCVTIPSYKVSVEEEKYIAYYKPIDISVHEGEKESKAKKSEAPSAPKEAAKAPAA